MACPQRLVLSFAALLALVAVTNGAGTLTFQSNAPNPVGQAAFAQHNGRTWVHGGITPSGSTNDISTYDLSTNVWEDAIFWGNPPPARNGHKAAVVGDMVYLVGGRDSTTYFDDSQLDNTYSLALDGGLQCGWADTLDKTAFEALNVGDSTCYKVTGADASVVGDNGLGGYAYTSHLGAAAVLAGLTSIGKTTVIMVTKGSDRSTFESAFRNSIMSTSATYGMPVASYTVRSATTFNKADMMSRYTNYPVDKDFHFKVTGNAAAGTVKGGDREIPLETAYVKDDAMSSWLDAGSCIDGSVQGGYCSVFPSNNDTATSLQVGFSDTEAVSSVQVFVAPGGQSDYTVYVGEQVCTGHSYYSDSVFVAACDNSPVGTTVRIETNSSTTMAPMKIYEVRVYASNILSLVRPVAAYEDNVGGTPAPTLVDVNHAPYTYYTKIADDQRLAIDLGSEVQVLKVIFSVIKDLGNVIVGVNNNYVSFTTSDYCYSGDLGNMTEITCSGKMGRIVWVYFPGTLRDIAIQDISVYTNTAPSKAGKSSHQVYSVDTPIEAAVVHAGILADGESGYVRVSNKGWGAVTTVTGAGDVMSTADNNTRTYSINAIAANAATTVTGAGPTSAWDHSLVAYGNTVKSWGGYNGGSGFMDTNLYSLDLDTLVWSSISTTGLITRAAMGYAVRGNYLNIFGGESLGGTQSGLYQLDLSSASGSWSVDRCGSGSCTSSIIPAASNIEAVVVNDFFYIYATGRLYRINLDDFTGSDRGTLVRSGGSPSYTPTHYHMVAYDPLMTDCPGDVPLVIFGGFQSSTPLADTYKLDVDMASTRPFTSTQFAMKHGIYAGASDTLLVSITTDKCGRGLLPGGKLEVTLPSQWSTSGALSATVGQVGECTRQGIHCHTLDSNSVVLNGTSKIVISTGNNALANPSFEITPGAPGWTTDASFTVSNDLAYLQTIYSLLRYPKYGQSWMGITGGNGIVYQQIALTSDMTSLTAKVWTNSGEMKVELYDAADCTGTATMTQTLTGSSSSTWERLSTTFAKPSTSQCAKYILTRVSGAETHFDDAFFGTTWGTIGYGSVIDLEVSGVTAPSSCTNRASWMFGTQTYLEEESGSAQPLESGSGMLKNTEVCVQPCTACKHSGSTGVYNCKFASTRSPGVILDFYNEDLETVAPNSPCTTRCTSIDSDNCKGF